MGRKRVLITFGLTMGFFLLLFFLMTTTGQEKREGNNALENELDKTAMQIAELVAIKESYLERADKHEAYALHFSDGVEAKRSKKYLKLARQNRRIADKISSDINELEEKKQSLMKEYHSHLCR